MTKAINGAGLMNDSIVSDGVLYLTPTGLIETQVLNQLSIYPNPTNNKATLRIICEKNEKIPYTLTDLNGKIIEEKILDIHSGTNVLEINAEQLQLSKGIYFIKLYLQKKEIVKKLIIE